jgi:two-component system LytT family sensor kinase
MFANGSLLDPTLINTIGHCAGALLFGVVVALLIRDGRANGMRRIRLSLLAAMLAFGWNVGSLLVIGSNQPDSLFIAIVSTASFSILSFLPAVLLQVTLQERHKWIVIGGYLVSACAACLHFSEVFSGSLRLHQLALISIVVGFGLLTFSAIYLRARQTTGLWSQRAEWISLGCLLLFTTSFLHYGYQHASSPWTAEITWHHLGIPVALILLLQDYRFLLLDTFIRFLVNSCLAGIYIAGVILINQRFQLFSSIRSSMFLTGLAVVATCLSLILFAYLRNAVQGWVSRVLFRRGSLDECVKTISQALSVARSEEELLENAASQVARHLEAERFLVLKEFVGPRRSTKPSVLFLEQESPEFARGEFHPEAQIPLRFSSGDTRFLLLGPRRGGRRYLSEDLENMRRLASAIVEQIERFRAEELRHLVNEAELRALQAQINPHFLFNALNALYGTIDRQSQAARQLVLNLADIFRYVLQENRTLIPLGEELRIVQAYLEIEKVRLGSRLETLISVHESLQECLIPVLSLQPLVENAVKHGISSKRGPGCVSVTAERVEGGVRIAVADTGVGFQQSAAKRNGGTGVGLENVRRRLAICYGPKSELKIESDARRTSVSFNIPEKGLPDSSITEGEVVSAPGLDVLSARS